MKFLSQILIIIIIIIIIIVVNQCYSSLSFITLGFVLGTRTDACSCCCCCCSYYYYYYYYYYHHHYYHYYYYYYYNNNNNNNINNNNLSISNTIPSSFPRPHLTHTQPIIVIISRSMGDQSTSVQKK